MTEGDEALGLSNIRAADVASLSETDEPCRIHKDCRCWEEATEDSMHFMSLCSSRHRSYGQSSCMACRRECIELFASIARPIIEHRTE